MMATAPQRAPSRSAHVAISGVSKRFGGVQALDDVDLVVEQGEIHALVGENGAGKSTLGKIIAGVHSPDTGQMTVMGSVVHYHGAYDALLDGITMIAQELPLVPGMTVLENVFLGTEDNRRGILRDEKMRRRFAELLDRTGFELARSKRVGELRIAEQQKVAVLCALARKARLIVMDEPTAALPRDDATTLLEIVRDLAATGTTIVYVSHFLEEVLRIADTVTVMKDGRIVRSGPTTQETPQTLVSGMLGRSLALQFPEKVPPSGDAPAVLEVQGLTCAGRFQDVSLTLRAGEILGLAGLVGSGRSEVARAIAGADRFDAGRVLVHGRELRARHPETAIRAGAALIPDSRKDLGLVMNRSVAENVALPHLRLLSRLGIVRARREGRLVDSALLRSGVSASRARAVSTLSGGNQQKMLFARWMADVPVVVVADEPTRGIDVGSRRGIYELLTALARDGVCVLLISNENEELLGLAHRILVMRRGAIVAELDGTCATEAELVGAAFGDETAGDGSERQGHAR